MPEFAQNGQQVLKDGKHFCDAASAEAAAEIVRALNNFRGPDWRGTDHANSAGSGTEIEQAGGHGNASSSNDGLVGSTPTPAAIAAYLESEAAKTPRARVRARTLLVAASNVRAGLWEADHAGDVNDMLGEQANGR